MCIGLGLFLTSWSSGGAFLVAPGQIVPPGALTRAQAGGARSTALGADGATWAEFGADVPRYNGAARRLLIEGQRTNAVRNPRWEGATVGLIGSGGVMPTFMAAALAAETTANILQVAVIDGLPCIDIQLIATAAGSTGFTFESRNGIPVVASTNYATSIFAQIIGGSIVNVSALGFRFRSDSATADNGPPTSKLLVSGVALTQLSTNYTTLADANAGRVQFLFYTTAAASITLRLAAPQIEMAAFASTPILPPIGTPGASTRGADLVSATLASLGIGANGACTVLWSGVLPQNAAPGAFPTIVQIDDGTQSNLFALYNSSASSNILMSRRLAGADSAVVIGSMTPGSAFRAGLALDGAGRISGSFNGGAAQVVTGGPASGLTTLRLGNNAIGGTAMFGEVGALTVLPRALSDADLAARVAAMPL